MPTIYDIPAHLLNPAKKHEFIGWVKRLPSEIWVKRELAKIWKHSTQVELDSHDYHNMGL